MSTEDKALLQNEAPLAEKNQADSEDSPSDEALNKPETSKNEELTSNSPTDDSTLDDLMHKLTLQQEDDEEDGLEKSTFLERFRTNFTKLSANLLNYFLNPKLEKEEEGYTLEKVAECCKNQQIRSIITMVGAGISTAAGIPDFRSPGKGLYHNLAKYNLPYPQAIFELGYFIQQPEPFFHLARELFPGSFEPTVAHYFIKLLHDKDLLLRHYTQNIDNLERTAGVPEDKLIEAHGTFYTSHCLNCEREYTLQWMKEKIFTTDVPLCEDCGSVVKPDIVFFGEALPYKFFQNIASDFDRCDLLIIMGSSLTVEPFASLVRKVKRNCPRIIINDRPVGHTVGISYSKNSRDVFIEGSCDDGCQKLADVLGWTEDFAQLLEKRHSTT